MIVLSIGLVQRTLAREKCHSDILPSIVECAISPAYRKDDQSGVEFHQTGKEQVVAACSLLLHPQPQQIYYHQTAVPWIHRSLAETASKEKYP